MKSKTQQGKKKPQ